MTDGQGGPAGARQGWGLQAGRGSAGGTGEPGRAWGCTDSGEEIAHPFVLCSQDSGVNATDTGNKSPCCVSAPASFSGGHGQPLPVLCLGGSSERRLCQEMDECQRGRGSWGVGLRTEQLLLRGCDRRKCVSLSEDGSYQVQPGTRRNSGAKSKFSGRQVRGGGVVSTD